ncbi:DUF924 family protein [Arhodomonas sp. SL1]|uniref:DUF924 family protein n=1 Tax=Arhodomonas sp. SL1 TaxID=3425691 RepID=UPI003F884DFD
MDDQARAILDYWFGVDAERRSDGEIAAERASLWFRADPALDDDIDTRFRESVASAREGALEHWADAPRGRLALILLLDQFPRNLYRANPEAYASDRQALAHSLNAQSRGEARELRPVERLFLYMPMMHAESLPVQDRSVALFETLAAEMPEAQRPPFERSAEAARRHREVILRFGRFPHRNAVLARPSTPAEAEFLATAEQPY